MFTGLIEDVGKVAGIERNGPTARLLVETSFPPAELNLGESIAVNGVCLTVADLKKVTAVFDVSPETIDRTGLRSLKNGSRVNLERALRLGDRFGGHIVTGHIDCVALVTKRQEAAGNIVITVRIAPEFVRYLVKKGSVTIDGVSLTINDVADNCFTVNVIPHTAVTTTLHEKRTGDEVNIETDIIGKYLERLLSVKESGAVSGITLDLLAKNGFL